MASPAAFLVSPQCFLPPSIKQTRRSYGDRRSNLPPTHSPPPPPAKKKQQPWKKFPGTPPINTSSSINKKAGDVGAAMVSRVSPVTDTFVEHMKKRRWKEALQVFEMLKAQPFYYPNEGTYKNLISLLGKSGQPALARQLFDEMLEQGIEPTRSSYIALMSAYCRGKLLDEAFSVLAAMKELPPRCQPDAFTYGTLLKSCVAEKRLESVGRLYREMRERAIAPDTATQNLVLGGYGDAGMFDEMESVFSGMLGGADGCKPDIWSMYVILRLLGNNGEIELMEEWYKRFRSIGVKPETRVLNIITGAYGRAMMYDKMIARLQYMRKLRFPWTSSTFNNVIEAFADMGDAESMKRAFDQMLGEGMRADAKTFCCLIKGFGNAGLFDKAVGCVKLAEESGAADTAGNVEFFSAAITACARAGDLPEMERVLARMKSKNLAPDRATYSILAEAYAGVGGSGGMSDKMCELEQEERQKASI